MPEIEKAVGLVVQAVTNIWQAVQQVQSRLAWISDVRGRGGNLGLVFRIAYEWPQHFYRWSLGICAVVGFSALIGGILKILNVESLKVLQTMFDLHWLTIIGIGALLFLLTVTNGLTWIPMLLLRWIPTRWLPGLLESPSWLYVCWFCDIFGKPRPLVIRELGIDDIADFVIQRLVGGNLKTDNFAEKPPGLTDDERANAALFGCLLEKEHYIRKGWPRRSWRFFYAAIGAAQHQGRSIFAPDVVKRVSAHIEDYYSDIQKAVNPRLEETEQDLLPDSAAASEDVKNAVELLATKYDGCAANLPRGTSGTRQLNLRNAFERVAEFPNFNPTGMVPQFLKLAVRWDVWPGIETGGFIYPFSSSIAVLFLNQQVLITLPEAQQFAFRDPDELLIMRETMRRVVDKVAWHLKTLNRPGYREFYQTLRNEPAHPVEWEIAQYVDFVLWSAAREPASEGSDVWKVESGLVLRTQ
jgi:hypothetical protein